MLKTFLFFLNIRPLLDGHLCNPVFKLKMDDGIILNNQKYNEYSHSILNLKYNLKYKINAKNLQI